MLTIKRRRLIYLRHLKRHDSVERLIVEGMVIGKRGRQGPCRKRLHNFTDWMGTLIESGRTEYKRERHWTAKRIQHLKRI